MTETNFIGRRIWKTVSGRRLTRIGLPLLVCLSLAFGWTWLDRRGSDAPASSLKQDALSPAAAPDETPPNKKSPDDQYRQAILGDWEDDYRGKRFLTLRLDGAATMVVEPDALGRSLFASKLQFDIRWSIEDGRLILHTLGGEPAGKVNLILKLMGDHTSQPIRELTGDRMILLDEDGETKYTWRRQAGKDSSP